MSDTNITQSASYVFGDLIQIGQAHDVQITIQEAIRLLPARIAPPERLFGRDALLAQTRDALAAGGATLLYGVGGIGKTALAATAAAAWLAAHPGSAVVWVTAGRGADLPALLNGIAASFGAGNVLAQYAALPDQLNVVRALLQGAGLLVLDDMWDADSLAALLEQGIPPGLSVLITGRRIFTRVSRERRFDVGRLQRSDALALLGHHAGHDYTADADADQVCATLGNHPYALVIAGAWLSRPGMTLARLQIKLADAPQDLPVPEEFGALPERHNIAALLAASVEELPEPARRAFAALGALFAPQATPELLAMVLHEVALPPGETETYTPPPPNIPDAWIDAAADALDDLVAHSLARYTEAAQYCAPFYALHDLTYAYARAAAGDAARATAVNACVAYARRHAQRPDTPEGVAHHNALQAELPNLLNAATWAAEHQMPEAVNRLGWDLGSANSSFLSTRGLAAERLQLLPLAAEAARTLGLRRDEGAHLTVLGLAYADLGRYREAIAHYEQTLAIAKEVHHRQDEGMALGNLGNAYADLGEYRRAIEYHGQALAIDQEIGDRRGEGADLGNLGNAYADLGEYRRAIEFYEQILVIHREIGDRRGEGQDLGNLGLAYADLGEYRRAIEFYEQRLVIAREIGDRQGEAISLNNIGNVHAEQGDYAQAIAFYEQARDLFAAMGMQHRVELVEGNIARARTAALTPRPPLPEGEEESSGGAAGAES